MAEKHHATQPEFGFRATLFPHRSLSPSGFVLLMCAIGLFSFVLGMAFLMIGAWPVLGFFCLDVLLIYIAFKLNYRSGRRYETVEVTREGMTITRVHPGGKAETFNFNPFWVRVRLREEEDGRTQLSLASQGREFLFAQFLTDDERRDFAGALSKALIEARGARI